MKKLFFIYVFTIFSASNAIADTDLWFECGQGMATKGYEGYPKYFGKVASFTKSSVQGTTTISYMRLSYSNPRLYWESHEVEYSPTELEWQYGKYYYEIYRDDFKWKSNISDEYDGIKCIVSNEQKVMQMRDEILTRQFEKNQI
jgi:hypothetical protein